MKAVRFHEYGGPDRLVYEEVPAPVPGEGELRIRVRACAINRVDLDLRSGVARFPLNLPHILGTEVAGDIESIGASVSGLGLGDRVTSLHVINCGTCEYCNSGNENICDRMGMTGVTMPGGYAEYLVVPAWTVIPLPSTLTYAQACCIQSTFGTVWHALVSRARITQSDKVLVNAAGSGVGTAAIQVAKSIGAYVIASAGSPNKLEKARQLGADAVVNYREQNLAESVRELTGGRGVDVVMECVGGQIFEASLAALAKNGRLVTVGGHAGEVVKLDVISFFRKQLSLVGSARATAAEYRKVIEMVGIGDLHPVIDRTYPLREASAAHTRMEGRSNVGRLVLLP